MSKKEKRKNLKRILVEKGQSTRIYLWFNKDIKRKKIYKNIYNMRRLIRNERFKHVFWIKGQKLQ